MFSFESYLLCWWLAGIVVDWLDANVEGYLWWSWQRLKNEKSTKIEQFVWNELKIAIDKEMNKTKSTLIIIACQKSHIARLGFKWLYKWNTFIKEQKLINGNLEMTRFSIKNNPIKLYQLFKKRNRKYCCQNYSSQLIGITAKVRSASAWWRTSYCRCARGFDTFSSNSARPRPRWPIFRRICPSSQPNSIQHPELDPGNSNYRQF